MDKNVAPTFYLKVFSDMSQFLTKIYCTAGVINRHVLDINSQYFQNQKIHLMIKNTYIVESAYYKERRKIKMALNLNRHIFNFFAILRNLRTYNKKAKTSKISIFSI